MSERPPANVKRGGELVLSVSAIRTILALVALAMIIVVGVTQRDRIASAFGSPEGRAIDHTTYQAVFLISSQVYFGKLTLDGDAYLLSDVFYLASAPETNTPGQLVKRGNELHGPSEPMIIPARSVLYFENLRPDAQVMTAIRNYKPGAQPTSAPATNAPQPTAAPTKTP